MSENYSDEIFNINERVKLLLKARKKMGVFTEEELQALDSRSHDNIFSNIDKINDDMDIAMLVTNGGLSYRTNEKIYNLGITQAILENYINIAYLQNKGSYQSWFSKRDENKDETVYELFAGSYFDKMFGAEGYRKIFSGDGEGFMKDLEKYGATQEEIEKFDIAINNSLFNGEYVKEEDKFMSDFSKKIAQGRKLYESSPLEEKETKKRTL